MIQKMKLHNQPFLAIKNGTKKVEMRLLDEKRLTLNGGGMVEFTNTKTGETMLCLIEKLNTFSSFTELYKNYPKTDLGYFEDELADPDDMLEYYTAEEIARYGVVAIGIKVV